MGIYIIGSIIAVILVTMFTTYLIIVESKKHYSNYTGAIILLIFGNIGAAALSWAFVGIFLTMFFTFTYYKKQEEKDNDT